MFPSPRNNTDSQVSLLQVTKSRMILYGKEYAKRIQPWLRESGIGALEMLGLDQVLEDKPVPVHPYNETFESAEFDPVVILHTSGSTGIPKPIYCKQGLFAAADNYHNFLEYEGFEFMMEAAAAYSKNTYCPRASFLAAISFIFTNESCSATFSRIWFILLRQYHGILGQADEPGHRRQASYG